MTAEKALWKELSFVMRAKNRRIILKALATPQTPSSLQRKTGISLNSASRALREMETEGIVKCVVPALKVGRIYKLTPEGEKVFELLEEK